MCLLTNVLVCFDNLCVRTTLRNCVVCMILKDAVWISAHEWLNSFNFKTLAFGWCSTLNLGHTYDYTSVTNYLIQPCLRLTPRLGITDTQLCQELQGLACKKIKKGAAGWQPFEILSGGQCSLKLQTRARENWHLLSKLWLIAWSAKRGTAYFIHTS